MREPVSVRGTPPALRLPALAGLGLVAVWLFACFAAAFEEPAPAWTQRWPWLNWFGNWEMFTLLDEGATLVRGEGLIDGEWRELPLEGLFPTRWESGPRYARSSFFKDPAKMKVFAAATCGRAGAALPAVRFYKLTWVKKPGRSSRKPPSNARRTELGTFECGRPVDLPTGRRL